MERFGQEVTLTIEDASGRPILDSGGRPLLDSGGLRIDFNVRMQAGFNRAAVTVFNLNEQTIGNLIGNNNDHYATLTTKLHGKQEFTLMDSFLINNTIDVKELPNTVTTLYCMDRVKPDYLDQQLNERITRPTLRRTIKQVLSAAGYTGSIEFHSFPDNQPDYVPPRPEVQANGSMETILNDLGREHNFTPFITGDKAQFIYHPDLKQVPLTDLDSRPTLTLDVNNMRANPKLAPAQVQITSNLDGHIRPGAVIDITKLLTAGTGATELQLSVVKDFAKDAISGYSRYQTLIVQHTGSNYTEQWETIATAVAPTKGTSTATTTWWK